MAMTSCAECTNSVSDKAASCPHCGAPIASQAESRGSGTQLTTVQETSKRLKVQTLLSLAAIIVGFLIFMTNLDNPESPMAQLGSFLSGGGFLWLIVTRIRIWWHHG